MFYDHQVRGLVVVGDCADLLLALGNGARALSGERRSVPIGSVRLRDAVRACGEYPCDSRAAARERRERCAVVRDGHRPGAGRRYTAVVVDNLLDYRELCRLVIVRDGASLGLAEPNDTLTVGETGGVARQLIFLDHVTAGVKSQGRPRRLRAGECRRTAVRGMHAESEVGRRP